MIISEALLKICEGVGDLNYLSELKIRLCQFGDLFWCLVLVHDCSDCYLGMQSEVQWIWFVKVNL